jgi:hypothetical protein
MKKILIFITLFLTVNTVRAQSAALVITNHSPCSVSVIPYAIAPAEGFSRGSCAACVLLGGKATLTTLSASSCTSYDGYPAGFPCGCVAPGWTDVQWVSAQFSYDCSGTSLAGCEPAPTSVNDMCVSCFGSSSMFSVTSCGHTFQVVFVPSCGLPMDNVTVDLY